MNVESFRERANVHAALADPHRLALADHLALSDRTPSELAAALDIESNLLAHHLAALERVGLIERVTSHADRRRRYIRLSPKGRHVIEPSASVVARRVVFICTENAARSQLAEGIWNQAEATYPTPAISAGTRPANRLHPRTIRAAARRGIDLTDAKPGPLPDLGPHDLVVTVCDRAHEELRVGGDHHLHWSLADPAASRKADAFDAAADDLAARINTLIPSIQPVDGSHRPLT